MEMYQILQVQPNPLRQEIAKELRAIVQSSEIQQLTAMETSQGGLKSIFEVSFVLKVIILYQ